MYVLVMLHLNLITQVGDPVEMAAITSVYSKGRTTPLVVASGKTNIGHTESCSGFAGIIKVRPP